jgi:bifunctional DNA-binding transcriptional regulator/antitoxin component of YhaV-PrlF toxin-antitoxin module
MKAENVSGETRIRAKNQMTLPASVVRAAGIVEGDRFFVEVTPVDPDSILLHRIRSSYAEALKTTYGDTTEYLEAERGGWV